MKKKLKKAVKFLLMLTGFCTICFLLIHWRVIRAWLTGSEMPKAPKWHKKCLFHK